MQITGKVVEVAMGVTIQKNGGGSYTGTRFTYRDSEGSIKEQAFHNNVLKFNPDIKKALEGLNKDDNFTMIKEKEGEFWNVKSITNGMVQSTDAGSNKTTSGADRVSGTVSSNTSPKSTYQTAEERAQTQVYIVRQSSITAALTFLKHDIETSQSPVTPGDVIAIAKQFEAHVMGTVYDDGSIEHLESDIL